MTYDEMRIRQAWPYEVKVRHAERVARDYLEVEWENLPGQALGQMSLEDLL